MSLLLFIAYINTVLFFIRSVYIVKSKEEILEDKNNKITKVKIVINGNLSDFNITNFISTLFMFCYYVFAVILVKDKIVLILGLVCLFLLIQKHFHFKNYYISEKIKSNFVGLYYLVGCVFSLILTMLI
jgi:hypothetical protein